MRIRSVVLFDGGFALPAEDEGPEGLEEKLQPVADWLCDHLSGDGFSVSQPEWFDYEFQIKTTVDDRVYEVGVSLDFLSWRWFEIYYSRTLGMLSRLIGRDENNEMSRLSDAIDRGLRAHQEIGEIRWYDGMPVDRNQGYAAGPVETH